jgi:RNA polymerase sigma-70 factor, ECF subfamily
MLQRGSSKAQATLAGNPQAYFDALIESVRATLFHRCWTLTRNTDDAEDLFQDTVVSGYRSFNRFDGDRAFLPWIIRICNCQYVNTVRGKHLQTVPLDDELDRRCLSPRAGDDPARVIISRITLAKALAELSKDQRKVFVLCEVEGLKDEEAAQIVGVPLGTIKSRLSSARKVLSRYGYRYELT